LKVDLGSISPNVVELVNLKDGEKRMEKKLLGRDLMKS